MNSSRVWGGLLCAGSAFFAVFYVLEAYLGFFFDSPRQPLVTLGPVTVMILLATGLAFWLGWIMATTQESPSASPDVENETRESET